MCAQHKTSSCCHLAQVSGDLWEEQDTPHQEWSMSKVPAWLPGHGGLATASQFMNSSGSPSCSQPSASSPQSSQAIGINTIWCKLQSYLGTRRLQNSWNPVLVAFWWEKKMFQQLVLPRDSWHLLELIWVMTSCKRRCFIVQNSVLAVIMNSGMN